ncbi:MAG: HAMP domain-containing sensor histidine kinase [Christensenellaceae bacterium]
MRKSIQTKFLILFIGIIFIASISSLLLVSAFSRNTLIDKMENQLLNTSKTISLLTQNTNLSLEEIIENVKNPFYDIYIYRNPDHTPPPHFDDNRALDINGTQVFFSMDKKNPLPLAMMRVQDDYVVLSAHTSNNEIIYFRNSTITVLIICAFIGSILILIAVGQITKPVKRLSRATKEVAQGNFDVCVQSNTQDEIGQLTNDFNKMIIELRNMEVLRKDFISNVSHEFKTPIASIQGFTRLLKTKDLTPEEFNEYTDVIIAESNRLSNMTSNILKLSRIENASIMKDGTEFSLDEQIRRTLLLLENEWSKKNIELDLDLHSIQYKGDEELTAQIWINLLSNAIKFSHDGGEIRITLEKENNNIKAVIADNGIGIPKAAQNRIFEKFYQSETSHVNEGNGLGLSIVKQIVEHCNGTISFESEEGKGTTFTVIL